VGGGVYDRLAMRPDCTLTQKYPQGNAYGVLSSQQCISALLHIGVFAGPFTGVTGPFIVFLLPRPVSVCGWTLAFLPDFGRLCGAIEGKMSHFRPRWLRTDWQNVISQGRVP